MRKEYGALVVGAGIGGIRAALDLAVSGQRVALIDARPATGGILNQLDHQFPSDHCGMCKMLPLMNRDASSQFCLRKGLFHDNIDIYLSTEMESLEGDPGAFQATLKQKSPLVDPAKCVSCGLCAEACPVKVPNEFNAGLSKRGAVYLPIPHAIPNQYVVDLDNCTRCWSCFEACPTGAIDFQLGGRKDFHVLVVSPEEAIAENLSKWSESMEFPVKGAASTAEAVDMLAGSDQYRLLLLDLALDDADRVLTRAKELHPDLEVALLAGVDDQERAEELMQQGAREWILKPLDKATIVPWLDKLYVRVVSDTKIELGVGAVVLSAGFELYDPSEGRDIWGYGLYPGVVTALELERMLSSSGPTGGVLKRTDGKPVRRMAWLSCIGSRDKNRNADFCSSICCMFSIKEALLAKKKLGPQLEATYFCMDIRTFGKNYDRYRANAVHEHDLNMVRCRPHSVLPGEDGSLLVLWFGEDGKAHEDEFDMVVLATGVRPPRGMDKLARAADIEVNEWGFAETPELAPARTSRLGVYAAGSMGWPKDIAESVIQSGAAALGASRMIRIHDVLAGIESEPPPEYRDVSREEPRILVALCTSCPTLESRVDLETLQDRLGRNHSVAEVRAVGNACTKQGWESIEEIATEMKPNRVLIGACMPYAYIPKLGELGKLIGLHPNLMDVVDVYTPAFPGQIEDPVAVQRQVYGALATALARLEGRDPVPPPITVNVSRSALIVGGGLAGMTSAAAIADHGYEVCLVEENEELGGGAMRLTSTLEGNDPRKHMEDLVEQMHKHPNIQVLTESRVAFSRGTAGKFMSAVSTDNGPMTFEHGVTILATGGSEGPVYDYGLRVHKTVMTQLELEEKLASGTLDVAALEGVAMIQCWRSRDEERSYCSRVCCSQAIKNLLALKKKNPDLPVYVFYRDIMTYGFKEKYYTEARKLGAIFIRYDLTDKPKVTFEHGKPVIEAHDPAMNRRVRVRADLLALSSGLVPGEVEDVTEVFGVPLNEDGFYQEAESKWRPLDFLKQGIYTCGLAHSPMDLRETITSAQAAASRALRILSAETIQRESVVAEVRHSLCSLCQKCVAACPYEARTVNMTDEIIEVDEILCQGCGSCAAVCPNSATVLRGFHDGPVMAAIDAALEEI